MRGNNLSDFSRSLQWWMDKDGVSVNELAAMMGTGAPSISYMRHRTKHQPVKTQTLAKYAGAFGVSVHDFFATAEVHETPMTQEHVEPTKTITTPALQVAPLKRICDLFFESETSYRYCCDDKSVTAIIDVCEMAGTISDVSSHCDALPTTISTLKNGNYELRYEF